MVLNPEDPWGFNEFREKLKMSGRIGIMPIPSLNFPFIREMQDCIQDPVFHAEGDVWTHTQMVMHRLFEQNGYKNADATDKQVLGLAALFHDVAKPMTRAEEFDHDLGRVRVTHHGHSKAGAKIAWQHLWKHGVDLETLKKVYNLILWHQRVFHIFSAEDKFEQIAKFSVDGNWSHLLTLARADNLGRIAPNTEDTALTLELLEDDVESMDCLDKPFAFASAHHKLAVIRQGKPIGYVPYAEAGSEVRIMHGLPGAGKDWLIKQQWPDWNVISLDQIREERKHDPAKNQGIIIQIAFERAKEFLRKKEPFIWNATTVTKQLRNKIIDLCLDYNALVTIEAKFVSYADHDKQNRDRKNAVPANVIQNMIDKYEPVSYGEAHLLNWW